MDNFCAPGAPRIRIRTLGFQEEASISGIDIIIAASNGKDDPVVREAQILTAEQFVNDETSAPGSALQF